MEKEQQQPFNPQESLQLITEMIQKAKASHFHESGNSAILWGSVIGFCGLFTFLHGQLNWQFPNYVWFLTIVAIIPQAVISFREGRQKVHKSDTSKAIDAIWVVYGFTVFLLAFYMNVVGAQSERLYLTEGKELMIKDIATNTIKHWHPFVFSTGSLFLMVYAIPTVATGLIAKFKPMLIGGLVCYVFFFISCFTASKYDFLMNGIAGIVSWLIPGIILRKRYLKGKASC